MARAKELEVPIRDPCKEYVEALQRALSEVKEISSNSNKDSFCPDVENLGHEVDLQHLRAHFHRKFKAANQWIPAGKISYVLRACINNQLDPLCIEQTFYRLGGIRTVTLLHLATIDNEWVFTMLHTLPEDYQVRLITEFAELHPFQEYWMTQCVQAPVVGEIPRLCRIKATRGDTKQKTSKRPRSSLIDSQPVTRDTPPIHNHDEARLGQYSAEHTEKCLEPHQDSIARGQIHFWDKPLPPQSVLRRQSVKPALEPGTDQTAANSRAPLPSYKSAIGDSFLNSRERMSMLNVMNPLQTPAKPLDPMLFIHGVKYWSFSLMRRDVTDNLPDPFSTAMKASQQWANEEASGWLPFTSCCCMFVPAFGGGDVFFVSRMCISEGLKLMNSLKMGEETNFTQHL